MCTNQLFTNVTAPLWMGWLHRVGCQKAAGGKVQWWDIQNAAQAADKGNMLLLGCWRCCGATCCAVM